MKKQFTYKTLRFVRFENDPGTIFDMRLCLKSLKKRRKNFNMIQSKLNCFLIRFYNIMMINTPMSKNLKTFDI